MRICSDCRRCYEDTVFSCFEASHSNLSESRGGTCEMIAGYRLDFLLGSDFICDVYGARHIESGRPCRIKIINAKNVDDDAFLNEARFASTLFHPNMADVYEAGALPGGELFVVTEDAAGETLRDRLMAAGSLRLLPSIQIVRQAAEAIHAAHLKGLIHRAIRPENIILTNDGHGQLHVRVKDLDLGGILEHSIVSNKFAIDEAIESLKYFSPEQCAGEAASIKTDVYSLGIVLYELLSGAPPFDAPSAAGLIEMHRNRRPPEIRIDDFDLRMLITHALTESLHKRPDKRQSSANAFARQLRHIEQLANHVSTPPPAGIVPPQPSRQIARVNVAVAPAEPPFATPAKVAETPLTASFARETARQTPEFVSRMKVRRKKLHATVDRQPVSAAEKSDAQPAVETIVPTPAFQPEIAQAAAASANACQASPARIEWVQPDDDIPTVADALAARVETQAEPDLATELKRPEVVHENFAPVAKKASLKKRQFAPVPAFANAVAVADELEEITAVTARSRKPIRIPVERPAAPRRRPATAHPAPRVRDELVFVPTLLGGRVRKSEAPGAPAAGSLFSAYSRSPRPVVPVSGRAIMIGGGFLALAAVFLIGSSSIWQHASTEGSNDVTEARAVSQPQSQPVVNDVAGVSPVRKEKVKYFEKPQPAAADAADVGSKPEKPKQPAAKNAEKPQPIAAARLASNDKGKTKPKTAADKRSVDKKVLSGANKITASTRPRIVKNPKP